MAEENTTFDEILEEVKSEAKKEKAKKAALLKTHPTNATLSLVDGNICIHIDDAHYVNGGYDIISEELNDMFDKCIEVVFAGDPHDIINNKNIYINDLERKVNLLENDIKNTTNENEKYRSDYTQLLEEHAALDEEYKATLNQLEHAHHSIETLQETINTHQETIDTQANQLKFFSDERAAILPKLCEDAEKINDLTQQLEEVTKQRDNYKEDCTCSEEEYRKLLGEHRDTEEELKECREALHDAEQECEDLRKHLGVISECLEDINALNVIIRKIFLNSIKRSLDFDYFRPMFYNTIVC